VSWEYKPFIENNPVDFPEFSIIQAEMCNFGGVIFLVIGAEDAFLLP
jgi:hypothetical protein